MEERRQFIQNLIAEDKPRDYIKRELISHGFGTEGFEPEYTSLLQEMGKTEPVVTSAVSVAPVVESAHAEVSRKLPSVGEMLGYGFSVTLQRWKPIALLALLSMLPSLLVLYPGDMPPYTLIIFALIGMIVSVLSTSAILYLVIQNEDSIKVSDALQWALRYFFPVLWIGLLGTFIVTTGLALLILPALIFTVYNVFTFIALVREDARGTTAIVRSVDLVRGAFLGILGRMALIILIFFGIGLLLGGAFAIFSVVPILKEIANIIATGIEMVITAVSIGAFVKLYDARVAVRPLFDRSSYRGLVWLLRALALIGVVIMVGLGFVFLHMIATFYNANPQDVPIQWGMPAAEEQTGGGFNFEDFVTQSNVEATAASATVYHGRMGSYEGVCRDIPVVDPVQCREGDESFMIFAPLSTGELYCADATSFSGVITGINTAQTTCK